MNALSIATSGLADAGDRFSASAERVAGGSADLATELTQLGSAKVAFEASVVVVKTTSELSKRLLDIMV